MSYDYRSEMADDIRRAIAEYEEWENATIVESFIDEDQAYEYLYDKLWADDSVTGNASGSYTFSRWQAEENLAHNFDLLEEACNEFGQDIGSLYSSMGAEAWDVTIRCYLLGEVLHDVVEEMFERD